MKNNIYISFEVTGAPDVIVNVSEIMVVLNASETTTNLTSYTGVYTGLVHAADPNRTVERELNSAIQRAVNIGNKPGIPIPANLSLGVTSVVIASNI